MRKKVNEQAQSRTVWSWSSDLPPRSDSITGAVLQPCVSTLPLLLERERSRGTSPSISKRYSGYLNSDLQPHFDMLDAEEEPGCATILIGLTGAAHMLNIVGINFVSRRRLSKYLKKPIEASRDGLGRRPTHCGHVN
jgi:hypothetical protein